jgi:SAM-dependent methyltransferase
MSINLAGNEFEFEALQQAHNYRRAIYRQFTPFIQGDIIEIGCGVGQFTNLLAGHPKASRVAGLEPDQHFHHQFQSDHPHLELIKGFAQDLTSRWDTIISINVLEHIEADQLELNQFQEILNPGGKLCILVPARPEIYAPIDATFGHFRRYTKTNLAQKLTQARLNIDHIQYFNPLGYLSWLIMCKLFRSQKFSATNVRIFDRYILPTSLALGTLTSNPIGQSLIAIATKKSV